MRGPAVADLSILYLRLHTPRGAQAAFLSDLDYQPGWVEAGGGGDGGGGGGGGGGWLDGARDVVAAVTSEPRLALLLPFQVRVWRSGAHTVTPIEFVQV